MRKNANYKNRRQKHGLNKVSVVSMITTACVLATSVSVIAAPVKDSDLLRKVTLPGAGINKVVSDYVEAADEAEIEVLAADILSGNILPKKDTARRATNQPAVKVAEVETEPETEAETEEFIIDEPVYEETYVEPVYEEPTEEIYYEPESYLDEMFEEPAAEEPVYEEPVYEEEYEEPVYEEETLEEFLEEQDQAIEEQAAKKKKKKQQSTDSTYLGEIIAQDALQYVGWLPYVWAGDSLQYGADCSGFTMAIYAQYGILLSHDSEVQSVEGYSVPLSEALPGDIVVYPGHVAMYIGNGQIVHSPQPGEYVSIADVNMMGVIDVRRMIQ